MIAVAHFQRVLLAGNTSTVWKRKLATFTFLNARYASTDGPDCSKKHLFKIARASKRIRTYDDDKIDKPRAMAEFGLEETDLADLKIHLAPTMGRSSAERGLYALNDVRHRAVKVHGSSEAVDAYRRPLVSMGSQLTDAEQMRMRMRVETTASTSKGSDWVVKRAFMLNVADASFKFCAAYLTGSKSLFAEAIHSTMDSCNQLILMIGLHVSSKNPDTLFPYGYGNMRYVTSLISGCGIMAFGCGLSIYHGVSGLLHPAELEPLTYAYMALTASLCFQGSSAFLAWREARHKAAEARVGLLDYVKTAADPSLNVVLLEDTAAVVGVGIALTCVGASSIFESPYPDAVGSILIGTLLGVVAGFIIRTNAAHLVGRSLPPRVTDDIISRLKTDPPKNTIFRSIHDVKATSIGVEQSRFKAEIDFNGREITHTYLKKSVDLAAMLTVVKEIETEEQLKNFMEDQGEKLIELLGDEIDRIEGDITRRHPDIRHIDIEAL